MKHSWLHRFFPRRPQSGRKRRQPRTWTPCLEGLEERWVPTLVVSNQTLALVEGQSASHTVATFIDTNPSSAGDYSATIDWGDGTPTTPGIITQNGQTFFVTGTHSYAEDTAATASLPVTVQIQENNPTTMDFDSGTANSTAGVAEGDLAASSSQLILPTEGQSFSGTVAFFNDARSPDLAAAFTASVHWGDGTTTAGKILTGDGSFIVQGTHTYGDEGNFTVGVQVTETGITNGTATTSVLAQVGEADELGGMGTSFSATQGQTFSGAVASFIDMNTLAAAGDFAATIAWGDGTTSAGTVTGGNGSFTVDGAHTYANLGSFPVSVTVQDDAPGTATTTAQSTATVTVLTGTGVAVCAAEGVPLQGAVVATFTDSHPQPVEAYNAAINWGDGTAPTPGTIQSAGGRFQVLGSHTYGAEGSYSITVTVSANGRNSIMIHSPALVGGFVTQLYHDVLDRAPDPGGLAFWVEQLHSGRVSRDLVAASFWDSAEHRGVEVDQFYQDFLHRAADPMGRAGWVSALLNGTSEGQVAIGFLTSAEYTSSHADNGSYVQGLYRDVLNRDGLPSELAYWGQILNSGARSRAAVAFYFLTSEEAYREAIDGYYRVFLRRPGDGQGIQGWLGVVESGAASPTFVAAAFLGSQEYLNLALAMACFTII